MEDHPNINTHKKDDDKMDGVYRAIDATKEDGCLGRLLNHSRLNPNAKLNKTKTYESRKVQLCGGKASSVFHRPSRYSQG